MSMFGALNRFISRLDAAPLNDNHNHHQSSTNGAYGFQVLRNSNAEIPLEPWFDYIIGINGRTIVSYFLCLLCFVLRAPFAGRGGESATRRPKTEMRMCG